MTSHGEAQSLDAFWDSLPKADREDREWLKGPQISKDDLEEGSARIERCLAADWWRTARSGDRQQDRQIGAGQRAQAPAGQRRTSGGMAGKSAAPKPLIFPFGNRHKGKLAIEVKEQDPSYWQWSITRADAASWWRPMVAKAGLLDEEDDS